MRADLAKSPFVCLNHPAIPANKKLAFKVWQGAAMLSILAGIVYAFWGGWWWALVGLGVFFAIASANRHTAARFVLETAAENGVFKQEMLLSGVIIETR